MEKLINKRYKFVLILLIIFFSIMIFTLIKITCFDSGKYTKLLDKKTGKMFYGSLPPRGNIYDRNGKLLVGEKLVKSLIYENTEKLEEKEEALLASKVSKVININYSKLKVDDLRYYLVALNKEKYEKLFNSEEKRKRANKEYSEEDLKKILINKVSSKELKRVKNEDKKSAYIFSLMINGYKRDNKTIKEGITEKEYAFFSENEKTFKGFKTKTNYVRYYPYGSTFKTFLGSVGNIPVEEKNKYIKDGYQLNDKIGISYLEKQYEKYLKGKKETYKIDKDGNKKIVTKSKKGNDLYLSIDINLQMDIERIVEAEVKKAKRERNTKYFRNSYVILSDPNTGEVLASVAKNFKKKGRQITFNDALPSLINNPVTPGSIVKGASHLVGYETGAIKFGTKYRDSCIKLRGSPPKCSWTRLGTLNDVRALALSSNYYQFRTAIKVGNGTYNYNGRLNANKSAFKTYRDMFKQFGLGVPTEIDLPSEGKGFVGNDKRLSNLLDFPIGQYDTYTPMQIMQYMNTLATSGDRYAMHYVREIRDGDKIVKKYDKKLLNKVKAKKKNMDRVRLGLSKVTKPGGTGNNYISPALKSSGKTGTSESFIDTDGNGKIDTETISSLYGAYMPRNKPKLSLVVIDPDVSLSNGTNYKSMITKRITKSVTNLYFKKYK